MSYGDWSPPVCRTGIGHEMSYGDRSPEMSCGYGSKILPIYGTKGSGKINAMKDSYLEYHNTT